MSENSSKKLVLLREGDQNAFRFFYDKYSPSVCYFISRSLGTGGEAEDIMHDAFINLWKSRQTIESEHHLSMFLYQCARHRCINSLRQKKTDIKFRENYVDLESDEDYLAAVMEEEVHRIIYDEIRQLPEEQRKVIMMHLEGKGNNEISLALDISVNTVKTHKARARRTLRENLDHLMVFLSIFNI